MNTTPPEDAKAKGLEEKIKGKIVVSTFLAGFSSSALIIVLTEKDYWSETDSLNWYVVAAMALLTCATGMFTAAVYMFDRLLMPRHFWEPRQRKAWRPFGSSFHKDANRHGEVYAHMIWVWQWVFNIAVVLAFAGFMSLVFHRAWILGVVVIIAAAAVWAFYRIVRPDLGID